MKRSGRTANMTPLIRRVEERFIRSLLEQYGKKNEYYIPLSKKDIASAIGTIPETLSRLLNRMRREGNLSVKGKSIVVD
jgi:CRP-like cAMP-binding protein